MNCLFNKDYKCILSYLTQIYDKTDTKIKYKKQAWIMDKWCIFAWHTK